MTSPYAEQRCQQRSCSQLVVDHVSAGLVLADAQLRIRSVNPAMRRLLGIDADADLLGTPLAGIFPGAATDQAMRQVLAGELAHAGIALPHSGGRGAMRLELSRVDEGPDAFLMIVAPRGGVETEDGFRRTFERAAVGLLHFDRTGRILQANPKLQQVLGYDEAALRALRIADIADSEDLADHERILVGLLTGELGAAVRERRYLRGDGDAIWAQATVSLLWTDGADAVFVAAIEDITGRKRNEMAMRYLASHDPLTALPNRALLMDRLETAIRHAQRGERMLALLFIDLDRFKNINDSLGHHIGDQVLVEVARRLQASVHASDTVARLGGDEFVVLLVDAGSDAQVGAIGRKVLDALGRPMLLGGHELYLNGSIGISLYARDGADSVTLLKKADTAMYHAKQSGKGRCTFYIDAMSKDALAFIRMEAALRRALERREFTLVYQPQVHIGSGRVTGFEALIRWQPPGQACIFPDHFIGIAEETGMIVPIGEWVLETACGQLAAWRRDGLCDDIKVSVNLSASQFHQADMVDTVRRTLEKTGCPPANLMLEITESVVMETPDSAAGILRQLSAMGVKLAIDDFGTGYSSLNYLKRFPIDTLKIDRSFVRDIAGDCEDGEIVKAVIALAHAMKHSVIAEGVEDATQLDFLRRHGCDQAQGYYFGKGVPAADAILMLDAHPR